MKPQKSSHHHVLAAGNTLYDALAKCTYPTDIKLFLEDLCTPAELQSMTDRWQVATLLLDTPKPQREINEDTGVSVTTIGRIARIIHDGHTGYQSMWQLVKPAG